jgi:hypothetical protein
MPLAFEMSGVCREQLLAKAGCSRQGLHSTHFAREKAHREMQLAA